MVATIDTGLHSNHHRLSICVLDRPLHQKLHFGFMDRTCRIRKAKFSINQLHLHRLQVNKCSSQNHSVEVLSTKLGDGAHNGLPHNTRPFRRPRDTELQPEYTSRYITRDLTLFILHIFFENVFRGSVFHYRYLVSAAIQLRVKRTPALRCRRHPACEPTVRTG